MKLLLIPLKLFLLISFLSCNNNPVIPPEDQPGRRDYVWTVDTLYTYTKYRMWGSSPTDIWVVGSGGFNDNIFHYDGNSWSSDGIHRFISPRSIWGFSSSEVYMGGTRGEIWRFDGSDWKEFATFPKDKNDHKIVFDNIWGEFPSDFYAHGAYPDEEGYGNNPVIVRFLNGKWDMLNTNGLFGIVEHLYKSKNDDKIYLQVIGGRDYTDSTHIYEYIHGNYNKLYSNIWTKGLQGDISLINDGVYFTWGSKIFIRINNQFVTVLNVDNPNFYQRIWGRNSKDIFLLMTDGLAHFNGTDIAYLYHFNKTRTQIYGASIFEKEVFFLIYEQGMSMILHGVLN